MKIYIFDFDDTLVPAFVYKKNKFKGVRPKEWLNNEENIRNSINCLEKFKSFVLKAIERGDKIAIATFSDVSFSIEIQKSYGDKWVSGKVLIERYLSVIFHDLPEIVTQIQIQAFYPLADDPQNKNIHIQNIIKAITEIVSCNTDQLQIKLFDDDINNIEAAREQKWDAVHINAKNSAISLEQALDDELAIMITDDVSQKPSSHALEFFPSYPSGLENNNNISINTVGDDTSNQLDVKKMQRSLSKSWNVIPADSTEFDNSNRKSLTLSC